MEKHTIYTDFSALSKAEASRYLANFRDIADEAFESADDRARLLGNLLIMEQYVHTICQGLEAIGEQPSFVVQQALDILWDYMEGKNTPADFEKFANNLFACAMEYNVGEELNSEQEEFYSEHFADAQPNDYEWDVLSWSAALLVELVVVSGCSDAFGTKCTQVDFCYGFDEMLTILCDACIELTGTKLLSNRAADLERANEQVNQTPLVRNMVKNIQDSLKRALNASSEEYPALRREYSKYTIIPKEYAAELIEF